MQVVERILTTGKGVGGKAAQGRVRLLDGPLPIPSSIVESDILVLRRTTREHVPLAKRAGGLVVVEGGAASHAARMSVELGLTAIVGAKDALIVLEGGKSITLDPCTGRVYEGYVSV